jgi:polyhydroxybutyrate depolymerase
MMIMKKMLFIVMVAGVIAACDSAVVAADRGGASFKKRQTLMYSGIQRSYEIRIPQGLIKLDQLVPLVLVLHGGGGNGENAEKMTGFTEKATKEGFIVVYPEGTGRFNKFLTWNARHCCGWAMEKKVDDVGFINALLDLLIKDYPVDPRRVYVTGLSNGGMMTHRLGIELSHRIAAIAPVIATLFGDEHKPVHPVSAIMINGAQDKSVPYQGGPPGGRFPEAWDGTPARPATEQAALWAAANGCESNPEKQERGALLVSQYRCPAGSDVVMYLINDNGHAWPGGKSGSRRGDQPSVSMNATDVIWAFFEKHSQKHLSKER